MISLLQTAIGSSEVGMIPTALVPSVLLLILVIILIGPFMGAATEHTR